jgi:hypothetical protein
MHKPNLALIKLTIAFATVVGICFVCPRFVIRALGVIVSLFLALNSYFFFEHAVLYRDKWKTATSGKRRTPPAQSVIAGFIFLVAAIALMIFCFWIVR